MAAQFKLNVERPLLVSRAAILGACLFLSAETVGPWLTNFPDCIPRGIVWPPFFRLFISKHAGLTLGRVVWPQHRMMDLQIK